MRIILRRIIARAFLFRRPMSSQEARVQACLKKANAFLATNMCPLPVILQKGKGVHLYDIEGKEYLDFVGGYASVSLGHGHPKLIRAVSSQAKTLAMSPRIFHSKSLINFAEYITQLFCYDKVLPCCTSTDASEAAVKLARRWGYEIKGIAQNQAKVIFPENNAWGSTLAAISSATDQERTRNFGPFIAGFDTVPFNNTEVLCEKLKDPEVCAFVIEPVQYDAGVVIPDMCYMRKAREICSDNNVLLIADEIHCGLGRVGCMLCSDIYQVRPDVLLLGKGLSGGILPISAILADKEIMDMFDPGSHFSTFAGTALACRVAGTVLKTIQEEKLAENAKDMGIILREELCNLPRDVITEVRGMGLLNAMVVHEDIEALDLSLELMKHGLLAQARKGVIRLTPPLTIREKEVLKATQIIKKCVENIRPDDDAAKCQPKQRRDPCGSNKKQKKRGGSCGKPMKVIECC